MYAKYGVHAEFVKKKLVYANKECTVMYAKYGDYGSFKFILISMVNGNL